MKMNFRPFLKKEVVAVPAATSGIRCFSVTSATGSFMGEPYGPRTRSTLSLRDELFVETRSRGRLRLIVF
jgi:hypothetical protein